MKTIDQKRQAVRGDLKDSAMSDRDFAFSFIDAHVDRLTDQEIEEAYAETFDCEE